MDSDTLLGNHTLIATNDPETARDALQRTVGVTSFDIPDEEDFFFRANFVSLEQITLASYYDSSGTQVAFRADDVVRQLICVRGSYDFSVGNRPVRSDPTHWSALIPHNEKYSLKATPNSALISTRITQSAIRRKIEALIGDCIGGEVQFEVSSNIGSPELESLRRAIIYLATELSFQDTWRLSPVIHEFQELLVTSFVLAQKHNFSHLLFTNSSASPSPWQLRRVEEYIEANFSKPVSVEQLAAVAGVSGRTLLRHFKGWRGKTPMEFVKQLRLQHSKTMLEKPGSDTTVLSVALQCGFQSPGHFSRDYRNAFDELPSRTLSRALRRRL